MMDWPLWRRWTLWSTAGELAGFAAPAVAGAWSAVAPLPPWSTHGLLVAAGFVEGLALGTAQAWALGHALPRLSRPAFALATGAAAVLAYAIGMLPSTLGNSLGLLSLAVLVGGGLVAGLVLLASIGTASAVIMGSAARHAVRRARQLHDRRGEVALTDAVRATAPRPILLMAGAAEADVTRYYREASPATVELWEPPGTGHTRALATHPAL